MKLTGYVLLLLAVYFVATTSRYRFRHPDLTETQLFLSIPAALILNP